MPAGLMIDVATRTQGDAAHVASVIRLIGALEPATIPVVEKSVRPILKAGPKVIVFDLTDLEFISSTGVGFILGAKAEIEKRKGACYLTNVPPKIQKAFDVMKALPDAAIFKSERGARRVPRRDPAPRGRRPGLREPTRPARRRPRGGPRGGSRGTPACVRRSSSRRRSATLAAGLRAGRGGAAGLVLAVVGTLATLAAFAAGAYPPWAPPPRTGDGVVYAGTLLAKLAALARARRTPRRRAGPRVPRRLSRPVGRASRSCATRGPAVGAVPGVARVGLVEVAAACRFVDGRRARAGLLDADPWPAAWARMASLMFLLDGTFRATRGALVACGRAAEVLSRAPWAAADLADFWGRRWNLLVARTLGAEVYGPLRRRGGRVAATFGAFLVSGVYHEALFVLPTGGTPWARRPRSS